MQPGGSDFMSGMGPMPSEELHQERAELIEIYLKMKQGCQTYEQTAAQYTELVEV